MRIYTRAGDDGATQLLGPGRVPKDDARVAAYGVVDEVLHHRKARPLPGFRPPEPVGAGTNGHG